MSYHTKSGETGIDHIPILNPSLESARRCMVYVFTVDSGQLKVQCRTKSLLPSYTQLCVYRAQGELK